MMAKRIDADVDAARKSLLGFLVPIAEMGLLDTSPSSLIPRWVRREGTSAIRVEIPGNAPLRFTPNPTTTAEAGRWADVYCQHVFTKERKDVQQHMLNTVIRVWQSSGPETARPEVIARFHVDLAEQGQHGPFTHLQFGGRTVPEEENWSESEHAGEVRWPCPLYDVVLATELVVYSLYPKKWARLSRQPEFITAVEEARARLWGPFFDCWNQHQRQVITPGVQRSTFLSRICNSNGANPWRS